MLDEFEAIHGGKYPGFITGKPIEMGGSLGRTEATGFGTIYVLREALKDLGIKPKTRASASRASVTYRSSQPESSVSSEEKSPQFLLGQCG